MKREQRKRKKTFENIKKKWKAKRERDGKLEVKCKIIRGSLLETQQLMTRYSGR